MKDRQIEDEDDDAEMAPDYGTDFSDDVDPNFDAKARPQLEHSGIGNRIQGNGDSESEPEAEVTIPLHSLVIPPAAFPGFAGKRG